MTVAASLMSYRENGAQLSSSDATGPWHSGRRLIGGALALCLILTLSACSDLQAHVREQALANARITIEKVSALAVENAIGLDIDSYVAAVTAGEAWPKPVFATVRQDMGQELPAWARGASFGAVIDQSGSYPVVRTNYAAQGQASAGSGFNSRIARVLVCVSIGVGYLGGRVDVNMPPSILAVECPADVQRYYGADELVTLDEVLAAPL
ncbi:hypothetical protein [Cryobacterium shii]|uniref:Uncharacterized protein n=1 Tax=Cryobacterium shii TaxID=1259235 RepID=A0AAQ2C5S4_9MICO|nr:hypothetical protein [Cryobacterium shii]TFC45916.1 hypothetical protein E3O49_10410 [Cryobacterium shii]